MDTFDWPWQYNFPPFFTIQPNVDTRKKQLEAWCNLVLAYYRHKKLYSLDVGESQTSLLFSNKKLDRKLSIDAIYTILEELCKRGNVEWKDKTKKQCLLMWRTPDEWGKMMYQWVCDNGKNNTVCTLYELVNGDDTNNEEFYGMEDWLLARSLKTLQAQNKAIMMGTDGVKFL
ncbi:vacuolar protein-sorting-associated protein 25-like [Lineus longissimus]|uniref:vacuolar protein-sorting-associated protein 25-like n=1 Tax=Lineus longissimus TaxID=88925 RepID=UPI002B4DA0C1